MQVYLPDDLYELLKTRDLPASELLQKAVRVEVHRMDLLAETDRYVADLVAEVGPPTAGQRARAGVVAQRAALLRRQAHRGSAVDAIAVALTEPGRTILTSDLGDLDTLAGHADDVTVERV